MHPHFEPFFFSKFIFLAGTTMCWWVCMCMKILTAVVKKRRYFGLQALELTYFLSPSSYCAGLWSACDQNSTYKSVWHKKCVW